MYSMLNCNKGKVFDYAIKILLVCGLCVVIWFQLSPPWERPEPTTNDGLATYELLETELEGLRAGQREALGEISNLRGELEKIRGISNDIRSKLEDEFANNLERGDDIMESGILIDENKLITNEVERRLRERN